MEHYKFLEGEPGHTFAKVHSEIHGISEAYVDETGQVVGRPCVDQQLHEKVGK